MVDTNAALSQHLFQIAQAEIVGQVPPYAQQDHRTVEMATFEHENTPPEMQEPSCHHQPDGKIATEPSRMISTGKRRRLNRDNRTAPRLVALH